MASRKSSSPIAATATTDALSRLQYGVEGSSSPKQDISALRPAARVAEDSANHGPRRVDAFGVHVNPGTLEEYVDLVDDLVRVRKRACIFNHNLHSLHLCLSDASVRRLYRNTTAMIDGMAVVWLLRLAGFKVTRSQRVTWVDFIWPMLERAHERGWRIFWVGHSEDVVSAGLDAIRRRLPALAIDGHHGYFDAKVGSSDSREVVSRINAFAADVCIVGMGMPRQERWVVEHRDAIDAPSVLASGACLEYLAGHVATPPRWMGQWGLEWSFRLIENPRRFAGRYLAEPWSLLGLLARRRFRGRQSLRTG